MEAVIEVRGGKVYAVGSTTVLMTQKRFLVGDRVTVNGDSIVLVSRIPLVAYAVVSSIYNGRVFLQFPQYQHFEASIVCHHAIYVGSRIIVYLTADGSIYPFSFFSNMPADDAALVQHMYKTLPDPPAFSEPTYEKAHYSCEHLDQTQFDTCTIDPPSSTDLDDAISIDPDTNTLYVHIVDICSVLTPELEKTMFQLGSTLYLSNESTHHLLPEAVLREASLDAGKVRKVITVEMKLATDGTVGSYRVYPASIVVKNRYTYTDMPCDSPAFVWLKERMTAQEHALPLDIPGLSIVNDSYGMPLSITQESSNDIAHRLVAYAMILANYSVSTYMSERGIRVPNRFHQSCASATAGDHVHITGHPIVDSFIAVKKWNRAQYDLDKKGHFGLALSEYVHFTSPMRRYADVLVHRLLAGAVYDQAWLEKAVEYLNARSLFVRQCHMLYRNLKVARYVTILDHIPNVYITSVAPAGVQWYMPEYLLNGFTHVSKIGAGQRWEYRGTTLFSNVHTIQVGMTMKVKHLEYNFKTNSFNISL